MQRAEKKLMQDIRKHAKDNQMGPVKIMAKDLVRTRKSITKFIEMKTQLNAVDLKLQTIKSHEAMMTAMKGVTKALGTMNKQMSLPGLQKVVMEFARENEKADMVQESIGEALDEAMADESSASEVNDLL